MVVPPFAHVGLEFLKELQEKLQNYEERRNKQINYDEYFRGNPTKNVRWKKILIDDLRNSGKKSREFFEEKQEKLPGILQNKFLRELRTELQKKY